MGVRMRKVLFALSALFILVSCQVEIRQFEVANQSGPYNCSETGQCEMKVLVLKDGRPLTGYTMTDAASYIFEYEVVGENGYLYHYRSYLDKAIIDGSVVVYPSGYLTFRHTFPSTANYQVFIHFYDFRNNGLWDRITVPVFLNPCLAHQYPCQHGTCQRAGLFDYRCDCDAGYFHPANDTKQCLRDACKGERCDGNGVCRLDSAGEPYCDCFLGYAHGDLSARMAPTGAAEESDPLSCIPIVCDDQGKTTGTVRYMVRPLTVSLQKTEQTQPDGKKKEILALDDILLPEVTQGCELIAEDNEVSGTALGRNNFNEFMKADRAELARFFYGDNSYGTIPFAVKHPHIITRSLLGDTKALSLLDEFKGQPFFAERFQWIKERRVSSCEDYAYKKYFMYNMWLDVFAESSDDPYLIVRFSATPGNACRDGDVTQHLQEDACLASLPPEDLAVSYGGRILYFGARHVAGAPYPVKGFDPSRFALATPRYVPNNPFLLTAHKKNGYLRQANDPYWGHSNDFSWHKRMFDLANSNYWKDTYGADITDHHFDRYRLGREMLLELLVNAILFRDLDTITLDTVSDDDFGNMEASVKENLEKIGHLGGWLQDVLKEREKKGVWPDLIQTALDNGAPVDGQMKNCHSARYREKNGECKTVTPSTWSDIANNYPENVIIESWSILTRREKDRVLSLLDKKVDTLTSVSRYGLQLADRLVNDSDGAYGEEIENDLQNLNKAIRLLNDVKERNVVALINGKIDEILALAAEADCLKSNNPKEGVSKLQQICGWLPEMFVESVRADIEQVEVIDKGDADLFCNDTNSQLPPIMNLPPESDRDRACSLLRTYEGRTVMDIMQADYRECIHAVPEPDGDQTSFDKLADFRDFKCKGSVGQIVDLTYNCFFSIDYSGCCTERYGRYDITIRNVIKVDEDTYDFRFSDLSTQNPRGFDACEEGISEKEGKELFLKRYNILGRNTLPTSLGNTNLCWHTCGRPGEDCNAFTLHKCTLIENGEKIVYPPKNADGSDHSSLFSCQGESKRFYEFTEELAKYSCEYYYNAQEEYNVSYSPMAIEPYEREFMRRKLLDQMKPSPIFSRWFSLYALNRNALPPYHNYFEVSELSVDSPFEEKVFSNYEIYDEEYSPACRMEGTWKVTLHDPGRRAYFDESGLLNGGQVDYAQDLSRFGTYLIHKRQYADYETALLQLNLISNGIYGSSGFSRDASGVASYSDKRYGYYQFGNREFNVHMGYAYGWGVAGIERFEQFNDFIDSLGGWPEQPGIHEAANLARALDGFYQSEVTEGDDFLFSLAKDFCEREIIAGKYALLEDSFKSNVDSFLGAIDDDNCESVLRKKIKQEACNGEICNYNDPETLSNIKDLMKENLGYFMPSVENIVAGTSEVARDIVNKLALNPYLYGYFGAGAVIFGMPLNAKTASDFEGLANKVDDSLSGMTDSLQEPDGAQNSLWKKDQTELFELVGYLQLNPNENGIPLPDQNRVEGDNVKRFFNTMKEESKNKIYHMHLYIAGKYLIYEDPDDAGIGWLASEIQGKKFTPSSDQTGTSEDDDPNLADGGKSWDDDYSYDWYFAKRVAEYELFGVTLTLDAGVFLNYGAKMKVQLGDDNAFTAIPVRDNIFIDVPLGQYARGKFALVPYVDVSSFVEGSASAGVFFASVSGTLGISLDILRAELPLLARYEVGLAKIKTKKGEECLDFFSINCYEGEKRDFEELSLVKPYLDMNASMSVTLDILKHSEIYAQADLSVLGITVVDTGKMTLFKDFIPGQMHYEYKVLELPEQFRRIDIEDISQYIRR